MKHKNIVIYLIIEFIDYIIQKKSLDQLNKISYFYNNFKGRFIMIWYTPKVAEVAVGLEINSYACAEV